VVGPRRSTLATSLQPSIHADGRRLNPDTPLSNPISLAAAHSLKIVLTTTHGKTSKRAHQAFLTLKEQDTGLEESFPFSLKENAKGKVDLVILTPFPSTIPLTIP